MFLLLQYDGFFTQDSVSEKFQMPNAIYMADQSNIFDSTLPKRFGILVFQKIKEKFGICEVRIPKKCLRRFI